MYEAWHNDLVDFRKMRTISQYKKLALIKRRRALSVIPRVNRGRPTRYTKLDVYFLNTQAFSLRISHTVEQVCPPIRVSISIGP